MLYPAGPVAIRRAQRMFVFVPRILPLLDILCFEEI